MSRVASTLWMAVMFSWSAMAHSAPAPASRALVGNHVTQIINRVSAAVSANQVAASSLPGINGIAYNGGPIMDDANGVNVYYIWYGDWSKDRLAQKVLTNLITYIGGSLYFNINTTYYSLEPGPRGTPLIKDRVINEVHYMGSTSDNYSQGTTISEVQVYLAIANTILSGALPADPSGVYFLLTSGDVDQTFGSAAFGTDYCGWHDSSSKLALAPVNGIDVKIAFVGNAAPRYAFNCIYNWQTTLSGSMGADGMASAIAHELEESVTDPDYTSWVIPDPTVEHQVWIENADMCAYTYPGPYHSGYGSDPEPPDMKFGGIPYLIQENWVNAKGGYCAIRWDD